MQGKAIMWDGKDLNELHASSGLKLATALADAMFEDDLKDYCMTANCKRSKNSRFPPWPAHAMRTFEKVMRRKMNLIGLEYAKRLGGFVRTVNGHARFMHKLWLEDIGVVPGSREAWKMSRAKIYHDTSSESEAGPIQHRRRRRSHTRSLTDA